MSDFARAVLRLTFVPLMKAIAPLFFDRRYLRGRFFEGRAIMGWYWAWRAIWFQKLLGFNRAAPFPVYPRIAISNPRNIVFDPHDLNNFQHFGCYYQNFDARIVIGRGTYIAPNVGLITSNHDPADPDRHLPGSDIVLGESCWIGMNAVVLPGVTLGDHTTVAAGAVVTRSAPEGNCVLAGVPARVVRTIEPGSGEA
jgi:acetyltransferase-like isoleucine patch superfamily enzyme